MPGDRDLELALVRLAWRIDALDKWREGVDRRLDVLEDRVDAVTTQEQIAKAVSAELHLDPVPAQPVLNWPQRIGAGLAAALVVADAVRGLIS